MVWKFRLSVVLYFVGVLRTINGSLPHSVCDDIDTIVIHYRNYYEIYLGLNASIGGLAEYGAFYNILKHMIPQCCPNTTIKFELLNSSRTSNIELESLKHLKEHDTHVNVSHFFFPEFAEHKLSTVYDFELPFVKLRRSPGQALIMIAHTSKPLVKLQDVFLNSYPLFLFMITLSWCIGLLGWMLDHWKNNEEFPSPFIRGMFEGFWWSIVTMTTVGYGDKSPKSLPARLLAIIWVLMSAILLSLFTANSTAILNEGQRKEDYSRVIGKKIGTFNSKHFHDFQLNLGAEVIDFYDYPNLNGALFNGNIDRILFPHYKDVLTWFLRNKEAAKNYEISNIFDSPFQIGMVLSRTQLSAENRMFLKCLRTSISLEEKRELEDPAIYSLPQFVSMADNDENKTPLNQESLINLTYYILMIIAALTVFGLAWDLYKLCRKKRVAKSSESVEIKEIGRKNVGTSPHTPRNGANTWF